MTCTRCGGSGYVNVTYYGKQGGGFGASTQSELCGCQSFGGGGGGGSSDGGVALAAIAGVIIVGLSLSGWGEWLARLLGQAWSVQQFGRTLINSSLTGYFLVGLLMAIALAGAWAVAFVKMPSGSWQRLAVGWLGFGILAYGVAAPWFDLLP